MGERVKYVVSHNYVYGQHHPRAARSRPQADEAVSRNPLERGSPWIHRRTPCGTGTGQPPPPEQQTDRTRRERTRGFHYAQSCRTLPKIVVDANILFAALIRNSSARALIFRYPSEILTPAYLFEEVQEYWGYLCKKSGISAKELTAVFGEILQHVTVIPEEELVSYGGIASTIMRDIDPKDALYIACALAHPGSIIWSEDKALKRQNAVRVLNTAEILELF